MFSQFRLSIRQMLFLMVFVALAIWVGTAALNGSGWGYAVIFAAFTALATWCISAVFYWFFRVVKTSSSLFQAGQTPQNSFSSPSPPEQGTKP